MAAGAVEALKAEVGGKCEQVLERSCTVDFWGFCFFF